MKYEAMSYPNLGLEKMKTDSTDVRVGPQIKGTPRVHSEADPSYITQRLRAGVCNTVDSMRRGTFLKYLKDIYTPAQCEVELHRGVGARLWFRPLKKQYNFNLGDSLTDTG